MYVLSNNKKAKSLNENGDSSVVWENFLQHTEGFFKAEDSQGHYRTCYETGVGVKILIIGSDEVGFAVGSDNTVSTIIGSVEFDFVDWRTQVETLKRNLPNLVNIAKKLDNEYSTLISKMNNEISTIKLS